MKKKPTQKEAVLNLMKANIMVTASRAYLATKKACNCGTVNLHKIVASIRNDGYVIKDQWNYNESTKTRFKSFWIDRKKTPKKLLQIS